MWIRSVRCGGLVLGLGACLCGSGCAAAGELGARAAVGVLEALLTPSSSSSSSSSSSGAVASTESASETGDTPCRERRERWQKAVGGSGEDAPAHLRCKPNGDWPDEEDLHRNMSSGL